MRIAVVAVIACHATSAPPVASWQPPPTGAYEPTDPFHVAVADTIATWSNPPSSWLCPIDGATFLCGTTHLLAIHGDRIVPDASLEGGRAPGTVEAVVGRWPDDAWLVTRNETGPNVSCGACSYVAHRWRRDHWERVADVANLFGGRWVEAWQGALFAVRDDRPKRELTVVGPASAIAARVVDDARCTVVPSFVASGSTFFILGATCTGNALDLTRWTTSGPVVDHPVPEGTDTQLVATGRGPAIIGTHIEYVKLPDGATAIMSPIALRFDRDRWISVAPPGNSVQSYAVAPDGTEWILVGGDRDGTGLYARTPGGSWQHVDGWRAEALRYGKTSRVLPSQVWVAEGSVWLAVTVEGDCQDTKGCEYRSLLLRTGPRAEPLLLARDRGV